MADQREPHSAIPHDSRPPAPPQAGGAAAAADSAGDLTKAGGSSALDRVAVERVLARASELQARGAEGGLLSESQILDVGREVGLSTSALRQALAEERTRVVLPDESGWAGRMFGPSSATASRTVEGSPGKVMEALEQWMIRGEGLVVKRRFTDRTTWEPSGNIFGTMRRWLNVSGRSFALMEAQEVAATVVPVDDERTLVRLDADLSTGRRNLMRLGSATAVAGIVTGGALAVVGAMVAIPTAAAIAAVAGLAALPTAAGLGGGYAIARRHEGTAERVQLALEQLLDRLEHEPIRSGGGIPPFIERLLG